jgi:hypothetical protein
MSFGLHNGIWHPTQRWYATDASHHRAENFTFSASFFKTVSTPRSTCPASSGHLNTTSEARLQVSHGTHGKSLMGWGEALGKPARERKKARRAVPRPTGRGFGGARGAVRWSRSPSRAPPVDRWTCCSIDYDRLRQTTTRLGARDV